MLKTILIVLQNATLIFENSRHQKHTFKSVLPDRVIFSERLCLMRKDSTSGHGGDALTHGGIYGVAQRGEID